VYVSDLASTDPAAAFVPFSRLFAPALRRITRSPLMRARHWAGPCAGPMRGSWCADCESTVDDLLLASYDRLRRSLTGDVPQTAAGTAVRELEEVVTHVRSAAARYEDIAPLVTVLRRDARAGESRWLRAARAQLIHYPALRLEERVRREDAVSRGGSARPDRDLRQAVWAAPLRSDPLTLELLLAYIGRLRHGAHAPFSLPPDLLSRLGIDARSASQKLSTALSVLRKLRPQYYAANVTAQLASTPLPLHADYAALDDWLNRWL
jgi:hypothetical protein